MSKNQKELMTFKTNIHQAKKLTILAPVNSIFQQNFDEVNFWYHGVFVLRNIPPSDNYL